MAKLQSLQWLAQVSMATVSLLEEFPSPPSHIPNPPPSLPPSLPLPPLPGPSPISDNFLRRSIASHRDSILFPPSHLDRSSISPYPLSDIGDDDDTVSAHNESISDIQLPLTDDDEDGSAHTATQSSNLSTADPIDPVVLHLQIRAARSRSQPHRQRLRVKSQSPSRAVRHPRSSPPPPLPAETTKGGVPDARSVSPDIPTILSKTPRPRKQHGTIFSRAQNSSRPMPRRVSDGDIALCHPRRPKTAIHSFASDQHVTFPAEIDKEADSDSSIDLHTPLPSLMVRDGLLSPRSKLLPTPFGASHESRGSICSVASSFSAMTRSGIMKDERDTPMRRHRHRDGRLLRGGIGLTTGLGWSDSEDEDAPSPLTRRLSSLSLARRASASSVQSAYTHPLSRSVSTASRLLEEPEDDETYDIPVRQRCNTLSSSSRYPGKSSHPPISWQNRPPTSSRLSSSSAGSKDSCRLSFPEQPEQIHRSISESDSAFNDILNTPSTGSSLSIPMPSTPSDEPKLRKSTVDKADKNKSLPPIPTPSLRRIPSNISSKGIRPGARPRTISSTSVPSVTHSPPRFPLPPVPTAASGSTTPRALKLPVQTRQSQSQPQTPTYRGGGIDRPAVPVPGITPATSGGLRPLSTSNSQPSLPNNPRSLPRLASRLPSKSPTTVSAASSPLPSPVATSNPVPEMALPKPRPRIGSGMVYRTSSYSGLDANVAAGSKLRAPKSLTLSSQPPTPTRTSATSLPPRPGMLRTPMSIPRRVAS